MQCSIVDSYCSIRMVKSCSCGVLNRGWLILLTYRAIYGALRTCGSKHERRKVRTLCAHLICN